MPARKPSRSSSGRKYSKKASSTVGSAMRRRKRGSLKTSAGRKVTSRKQALAIGLSEAREKGEKVPRKRASRKTARKATTRKSSASRKVGVRTGSRTTSVRKSAGRKTPRKSAARKSGRKSAQHSSS